MISIMTMTVMMSLLLICCAGRSDDARDIAEGKITAGDLGSYRKPFGFVTVPIYGNYGAQIQKRLQAVVDAIFVKGVPPTSIIA